MAVKCDLTISFATSGNSPGFLGGGWARSEDRFAWGVGAESHLMFPAMDPVNDYVLTLDVIPFVHPPELSTQRLIVSVNDVSVGSAKLSRPTLLAYRIPGSLAHRLGRMVVTLQHPDAARPSDFPGSMDTRHLAVAVLEAKIYRVTDREQTAATRLPAGLMLAGPNGCGDDDWAAWATAHTGLTLPQLALQFESLGENCEFGLFQRRCDAEPLGLLRFSSTFMRNLIRGIDSGFDGLGTPETIEPRLEGEPRKEYMIHESTFGLVYHTFVYEGQRSVWLMREQESARLKFLRRKFMEEMQAAEKLFVYKFSSGTTLEEVLPLHMALNRHAEVTLLWVVPAERDRPAGTVEVIAPGLLKGYIDRFAPDDNAHDFSFTGWLRVCANACVLGRLTRPGADDSVARNADPLPRVATDGGSAC